MKNYEYLIFYKNNLYNSFVKINILDINGAMIYTVLFSDIKTIQRMRAYLHAYSLHERKKYFFRDMLLQNYFKISDLFKDIIYHCTEF